MKLLTLLCGLSSLALGSAVHASATCSAGQASPNFGPTSSDGYVQVAPLNFPSNAGDGTTDGEGIAFDSSENAYFMMGAGGNTSAEFLGVSRIAPGGTLDRGYGGYGYVVPGNQPANGGIGALAVDNQDRLVFVEAAPGALVAARFLPDGTPDATFGSGGSASLPIAITPNVTGAGTQTDGKILVATRIDFPGGRQRQAAIVRLNVDGSLDTAFGTNGVVFFMPNGFSGIGRSSGVTQLADGRIVAIGTLYADDGSIAPYAARVLANGSLDPSFGNAGISVFDFGVVTYGRRFAMQTDGKIVIAGNTYDASGVYTISVERVNTNGSLDATFGVAGRANFASGFLAETMALQGNGRVLVAGGDAATTQAVYARLTAKGQVDTTFGTNGIAIVAPAGAANSSTGVLGVSNSGKVFSIINAAFSAGYNTSIAVSLCH